MNNLSNSVHRKVMHCKSAYDVWEKLKKIYEGDTIVKQEKLQVLREKFEGLTMTEEENIAVYLQKVDDLVNVIKGYGVNLKEEDVLKVHRFMTTKYDAMNSAIKEGGEIDKLTLDEVHGMIIAYEMIIPSVESSRREDAFKVVKKEKDEANKKENTTIIASDYEETDEEEVNFIIRLRRESDKYKGKLPFKCFNCGRIGHFASKYP